MQHLQKAHKQLFFKWNEGKFSEHKLVSHLLPSYTRYFEPFAGNLQFYSGLAPKTPVFLNDTDKGLINFYKNIGEKSFANELKWTGQTWDLLDKFYLLVRSEIFMVLEDFQNSIISKSDLQYVVRVIILMNTNNPTFNKLFAQKHIINFDAITGLLLKNTLDKLQKIKAASAKGSELSRDEADNLILTSIKSSFYTHFVDLLNQPVKNNLSSEKMAAIWFMIHELGHGNEFRPAESKQYEICYGGSTYNHKNLVEKAEWLNSREVVGLFKEANFSCLDFEEFLAAAELKPSDFVLINLPLRKGLYNPNNVQFSGDVCKRLANLLSETSAQWMVIARKNEENTPLFKIQNTKVEPILDEKKPTKGANFFTIRNF